MWALTVSVNDYRQHGEYFVAVYDRIPTREDFRKTLYGKSYDPKIIADGIRDKREKFITELMDTKSSEINGDEYILKKIKPGRNYW